jgi:hypothetical protein
MVKVIKSGKIALYVYLLVLPLMFSCASEKRIRPAHAKDVAAGGPVPSKVWVQHYFIYRHGRYQFVKGHYRPVISKKAYLKRSVKGYTSNNKYNNVN